MSLADYMRLFQNMDAETRERFTQFVGKALQSGNVSVYLRDRVKRLFEDDPWANDYLGCSRHPTVDEVNAAYRRTIAIVHSDKLKEDRFMKLASRARDVLLASATR